MANLNTVVIQGRLVADPEIKCTNNGTNFCNFSIATDDMRKHTSFIEVTMWGKAAEHFVTYHKKGDMCLIHNASLVQQRWEDQNGNKRSKVVVNAMGWSFCGSKKQSDTDSGAPPMQENPFPDDDIPF